MWFDIIRISVLYKTAEGIELILEGSEIIQ